MKYVLMEDAQNEKIQSIQGFRALGFVCVFLWHCGYGNAGAFAVSLFIMLSGYLLMLNNSWGGEKLFKEYS